MNQVWIQAGSKEMLVLAHRHMKWGLISNLLKRAFSWHPWIPSTLKLEWIWSLFKCEFKVSKQYALCESHTTGNSKFPRALYFHVNFWCSRVGGLKFLAKLCYLASRGFLAVTSSQVVILFKFWLSANYSASLLIRSRWNYKMTKRQSESFLENSETYYTGFSVKWTVSKRKCSTWKLCLFSST